MGAKGLIAAPLFERAVAAGIRAPSMYNAQPWRFRLDGDTVVLSFDDTRALPASDPRGWAARLALGAAAYNTQLALAAAGVGTSLRIRSAVDPLRLDVVATGPTVMSPRDAKLTEAIEVRASHRTPFGPQPVPAQARVRMVDAAVTAGAWIELVDDRAQVSRIAEILNCAEAHLQQDSAYAAEFSSWVGVEESRGEGIATMAAGVRPEGQDLLPMRDFGGRVRAAGRDFESDPLIAALGTVGGEPHDDVIAGVALQRVLLTITADGLCSSMLSQAIEVASARAELRDVLGHYGAPQMIIRIGYGEPRWPSSRRPISAVIDS
jgi:hypothetical protein